MGKIKVSSLQLALRVSLCSTVLSFAIEVRIPRAWTVEDYYETRREDCELETIESFDFAKHVPPERRQDDAGPYGLLMLIEVVTATASTARQGLVSIPFRFGEMGRASIASNHSPHLLR